MAKLTVVICTHNPTESIFSRTLRAVAKLDRAIDGGVEGILVDNASRVPLCEQSYIHEFLQRCPWFKLLEEKRAGRCYALIKAIRAAASDEIVLFDDDCEPEEAYLRVVHRLFKEYPWVGIWGAGNVQVEYLKKVSFRFRQAFDYFYIAKSKQFMEYGCMVAPWLPFFPSGVGLSGRRAVLELYCHAVESGQLTFTGPKGLLSGMKHDDSQINLLAIRQGHAVGVHPDMKVLHIIPESRIRMSYQIKENYLNTLTNPQAFLEIFPEMRPAYDIRINFLGNLWVFLSIILKNLIRLNFRAMLFEIAGHYGNIKGVERVRPDKSALQK